MINWFDMPTEGLSNGGQFEIKELTATENKVYQKDGEVYNKVTVNVEGGGGSSDFSTAAVTVTYTLPEEVASPEGLVFGETTIDIIKAEDNEYFDKAVTFLYGGTCLPYTMLDSVSHINVPLISDGYFTDISRIYYEIPNSGSLYIDLENSTVVSGDAEIDTENSLLKVTGDCVLNLVLGWL